MGLMARSADMPDCTPIPMEYLTGGDVSAKRVYGMEASLTVVVRSSGYHSEPHFHNSEQLKFVVEGELWVFVEDKGYRLHQGDYFRVPYGAVHWSWNRASNRAVLIESHTPPLIGNRSVRGKSVGLFEEDALGLAGPMPQAIFVLNDSAQAVENRYQDSDGEPGPSLLARADQTASDMADIAHKFVYGNRANLQVSTWVSGYHSHPHVHECEQLNYLLTGEGMWIFVEEKLYELRQGDFLRVPAMAVHWGWNRGGQTSAMVGIHAPCLDPFGRRGAMALFGPAETPNLRAWARAIMVADQYMKAEARYL